jgi:hypothetical protein
MLAWIRRLLRGRSAESKGEQPTEQPLAPAETAGCSGPCKSFPARLMIHNSAYALDGGTISLQAVDEGGEEHRIVLVQHAHPDSSPSRDAIPGRLYFDGELIPIRSDLEAQLLRLLRGAEIEYSPADLEEQRGRQIELSPNVLILGEDIRQVLGRSPENNLRGLLGELLSFVESEACLSFAAKVECAGDLTPYDVWVEWEGRDRKQAIVALGSALRLGVKASRELLDGGGLVAQAVPASEVMRLSDQFRASGLDIRVRPEFRWRLE